MNIIIENGSQIMKYHTKNKIAIINCLKENSNRHLTIEEIDGLLGHKVPVSSIYRVIDELVNEGQVRKYIVDQNSSACFQYVGSNQCHEHFHLLCTKCGKLIHLECDEIEHIISHIQEEHNFAVDITKTTLYGVCEECQKASK